MIIYPRFNHGESMDTYTQELFIMAEKKFELAVLEIQWIKKALEDERLRMIRARGKEMPGSEIAQLRGREVDQLTLLIQKFI